MQGSRFFEVEQQKIGFYLALVEIRIFEAVKSGRNAGVYQRYISYYGRFMDVYDIDVPCLYYKS